MITEYILGKALDAALTYSKKLLSDARANIKSNKKDIQESIGYHLNSVNNWCDDISFNDLRQEKATDRVFVNLDIFVYPRRLRLEEDENIETIPLREVFTEANRHIILLGQPGSGKTTSMKHFCLNLFHDGSFYPDRFDFPIVIKFRDINADFGHADTSNSITGSIKSPVIGALYRMFGLEIHFADLLNTEKDEDRQLELARKRVDLIEKVIVRFLDNLNVLLILDGFDELTLPEYKQEAISEIQKLIFQLQKSTIVVTSRTGDFPYNIEGSRQFEICPLNKQQIFDFANKWLEDPTKATKFLKEIELSPFADTTIKPLTIAHLCAIFERIGKIPDKPKTVYRKIVNLLLEEWDEQRSVKRISRYANFEPDRKFDFLCNLAYELTTDSNKSIFSSDDLLYIYKKIHENFGLIEHEAKDIVSEIESHTGLFVQAGYHMYEFIHKSLQEYLTAEHTVKLPQLPFEDFGVLPNELAIATSISSDPSKYLTHLTLSIFINAKKNYYKADFIEAFIERLAQEKPDFNTKSETLLCLTILYSIYIENLGVNDNIGKLLRSMCGNSPQIGVFKYYRRSKNSKSDVSPLRLWKTIDIPGFELPPMLYSTRSFLE